MAFVHSPLLKRRRRVSKALLHITDWFPTLVGLAGGNISQVSGTFEVFPQVTLSQRHHDIYRPRSRWSRQLPNFFLGFSEANKSRLR